MVLTTKGLALSGLIHRDTYCPHVTQPLVSSHLLWPWAPDPWCLLTARIICHHPPSPPRAIIPKHFMTQDPIHRRSKAASELGSEAWDNLRAVTT